jgi:sulfopyruvate decarboxylase alpha subunit
MAGEEEWPDGLYELLQEFGVRQVAYVPDAGHSRLIRRAGESNEMKTVPLASEEEGVALLAGAHLGGERGVLLMQSSGVGNCVNMLSLMETCRFPLLILVTMRGDYGEFNPWQNAMGQATAPVLEAMGALVFKADDPARIVETARAAARMAFEGNTTAAVLIGQRVIGAKSFGR